MMDCPYSFINPEVTVVYMIGKIVFRLLLVINNPHIGLLPGTSYQKLELTSKGTKAGIWKEYYIAIFHVVSSLC